MMENNISINEVLTRLRTLLETPTPQDTINRLMNIINSKDEVLENVLPRLHSNVDIDSYLQDKAYTIVNDEIAMSFYVAVGDSKWTVTEQQMEALDISIEELYESSLVNGPTLAPVQLVPLVDIMKDMLGINPSLPEEESPIYLSRGNTAEGINHFLCSRMYGVSNYGRIP